MRYIIKSARNGIFDMEPEYGLSVAEVELQDDSGHVFFLCLAEVFGEAICLKSAKSILERVMVEQLIFDDEEFFDKLNDCRMDDYTSYDDIFDEPYGAFYEEFRYLVYLNSLGKKAGKYIAQTIGKSTDELKIPVTKTEKKWKKEFFDVNNSRWEGCVLYGSPGFMKAMRKKRS